MFGTRIIFYFNDFFCKFPPTSDKYRKLAVRVIPWIGLILGLSQILLAISTFGLSTIIYPFLAISEGLGIPINAILSGVFAFFEGILMILATPKLLRRQTNGWIFLFWSQILALFAALLRPSLTDFLLTVILFYFLFQIKSYFKVNV